MVKLETDLETDSCSPLSFPFSFSGFQSSDQKIECFNSTNGKKKANFRSKYEDLLNRQTRDPREEVREGEIQVSGIGGQRGETMGSGHKYACLRGPVVHVPVIVISPSDRRRLVEGGEGERVVPVIHSNLDCGDREKRGRWREQER